MFLSHGHLSDGGDSVLAGVEVMTVMWLMGRAMKEVGGVGYDDAFSLSEWCCLQGRWY